MTVVSTWLDGYLTCLESKGRVDNLDGKKRESGFHPRLKREEKGAERHLSKQNKHVEDRKKGKRAQSSPFESQIC